MEKIGISPSFRKMAVRAIIAIIFFIIVYFLLVILAALFTLLCGYGGLMIILTRPSFITIAVGAGVISVGFFIMFFLVKFIFSRKKTDLTHLVEVTAEQEPELFAMIAEIVAEVKTHTPRKVYFSADVNAAVFYDSSFWSMIFPVKKNLEIGMGLMNTVSADELKAILAHEFGHFSQRSMKIGTYVYNVNKVIYNMLYDNENFGSAMQRWANVNGYISFFMRIAVKIIQGIQWILRKTYDVVNRNYMALSREMEFHADEVAANVAGSSSLVSSLLRLDLASYSYSRVIDHYNNKIAESVRTSNIYPQQYFVMQFQAGKSKLEFVNGVPAVNSSYLNRFNKSGLNFEDQWSSHPSTRDRVVRLEALNIATKLSGQQLSTLMLRNEKKWQVELTEKLFSGVTYEKTPVNEDTAAFESAYLGSQNQRTFPDIYNGYYDYRNPVQNDLDLSNSTPDDQQALSVEELFSDRVMDLIYTRSSMESDIESLKRIHLAAHIKTFDYNGQKYVSADGPVVAEYVTEELSRLNKVLEAQDGRIFQFFMQLAAKTVSTDILSAKYRKFTEFDKEFDRKYECYKKMAEDSQFLHETTPFDEIEAKLPVLNEREKEFRIHIREFLDHPDYKNCLTPERMENLNSYLSLERVYFTRPEYDEAALNILFTAMNIYSDIIGELFYFLKNDVLTFQQALLAQTGLRAKSGFAA